MALGIVRLLDRERTANAGDGATDVAANESYEFHRFGGGAALGARVASKDPHLRFTGAVLGGFATMGNIYKQDATCDRHDRRPPSRRRARRRTRRPLVMADAGVLVGWANGAKVHVAFVTMLQFVGGPVLASPFPSEPLGGGTFTTPALQVAQGTQVFMGPMIGFDFGL